MPIEVTDRHNNMFNGLTSGLLRQNANRTHLEEGICSVRSFKARFTLQDPDTRKVPTNAEFKGQKGSEATAGCLSFELTDCQTRSGWSGKIGHVDPCRMEALNTLSSLGVSWPLVASCGFLWLLVASLHSLSTLTPPTASHYLQGTPQALREATANDSTHRSRMKRNCRRGPWRPR